MLSASASFYIDGENIGELQIEVLNFGNINVEDKEYLANWTGQNPEDDVTTNLDVRPDDSVRDLFAMALVEVDAILAERAVN